MYLIYSLGVKDEEIKLVDIPPCGSPEYKDSQELKKNRDYTRLTRNIHQISIFPEPLEKHPEAPNHGRLYGPL